MSVKVYGASDDLVEIEGDIYEEFNPPYDSDGSSFLGFSNGVVLEVVYTDSVWRIRPATGGDLVKIEFAPADDDSNYSDVATVEGDILWAVFGPRVEFKK